MTAPERLSDTAPWRDWFERAMNSGAPNLDNASDPDVIGHYGLEWDRCPDCGRTIPGDVDRCDECAPCPHRVCRFIVGHDPLCPERQDGAA